MKYKGTDILDVSGTPRVIIPPRDMLVWDDDASKLEEEPQIRKVLAIVNSKLPNGKVICETECMFVRYGHCAEIPKPRRATNRELSKWLAHGNGEVTEGDTALSPFAKTSLYYDSAKSNDQCSDYLKVRTWNDDEWHEPTIDYMGIKEAI